MSITNLSPKQLRRAAVIKEQIEKLQTELNALLGSNGVTAKPAKKGRRKMSAAAKAKISAAAKKRWAKVRAAKK